MRKVYFLAAAVAATLSVASCATSEVIDSELTTDEATPIGFGTFLDRVSRGSAAASPKANVVGVPELKASGAGFKVFAYYTAGVDWETYKSGAPETANFMDNFNVAWNSTAWEYAPLRYWPRTSNDEWENLTFFAYSTPTGTTAAGQQNNNPKIHFITEETASTQVDLVAAVATDVTKASGNGKVDFDFKHILSKIGFKTKFDGSYESATTVKIHSLRVYYKSGQVSKTADYTFPTGSMTPTWVPLSGSALDEKQIANSAGDQLFYSSAGEALDNTGTNSIDLCVSDNSYLMLIPQTPANGDVYVELQYQVTTGTTPQTITKLRVDLPTRTWEPGKAYTYNLLVSLTGVTFDTIVVTPWDDIP
jgi:hypothetical protein